MAADPSSSTDADGVRKQMVERLSMSDNDYTNRHCASSCRAPDSDDHSAAILGTYDDDHSVSLYEYHDYANRSGGSWWKR